MMPKTFTGPDPRSRLILLTYGLATVRQAQRALSSLLWSRAIPLGIVHAPDEQTAEAAAIEPPAKPRAKRGLKMMAL